MGSFNHFVHIGEKGITEALEEAKRQMEAEAKARHEKQMKMRRAAMVVDLAQAIMLAGVDDPFVVVDPKVALAHAEAFVSAAEKYLVEKGE